MREFASLEALAEHFARVATAMQREGEKALEQIGVAVRDAAKAEYGHYQDSKQSPQGEGFPEWRDLADATVIDRLAQGFTPDDPLLRTGELRDSVEFEVIYDPKGGAVTVGSPDPVAGYQEFGTASVPPRPAIGPAMATRMEENIDALMRGVERAFEV